ncbi:glutamate ABC transporter substrate-binding protein [Kitasatospora indigofera]|uniref:glutamate ABC transporter substrate-binding protein n=1 Tax=Kitasatospora indigofera TaxID=67307 RepID=UPI00324896AB
MRTAPSRTTDGAAGTGGDGSDGTGTNRAGRARRARAATVVALLAAGATLLGAGSPQGAGLPAAAGGPRQAAPQAAPAAPAADPNCDTSRSVPPSTVDGPAVKAIKDNKTLVIGVDQNSYRWGARNPATGEIEGFDIDLAKAIGTALMGDPNKVTFKAVPTAERIKFIQDGRVDMIVRTMTITCERMDQVAFSKPYFKTANRLLVPKARGVKTFDEALNGRTACAARSSSAEDELTKNPHGSKLVTVENQLDCLVLMQLGKVDATMTDDGLAAGQAAQDSTVTLLDEQVRPGVMGVAMKLGNTDLVARVNQVLADYQASGAWRDSYDKWLKPTMHDDAERFRP